VDGFLCHDGNGRTCMFQKSKKAMKHATMEPSAKPPEKRLVAQGLHTCFRRRAIVVCVSLRRINKNTSDLWRLAHRHEKSLRSAWR